MAKITSLYLSVIPQQSIVYIPGLKFVFCVAPLFVFRVKSRSWFHRPDHQGQQQSREGMLTWPGVDELATALDRPQTCLLGAAMVVSMPISAPAFERLKPILAICAGRQPSQPRVCSSGAPFAAGPAISIWSTKTIRAICPTAKLPQTLAASGFWGLDRRDGRLFGGIAQ